MAVEFDYREEGGRTRERTKIYDAGFQGKCEWRERSEVDTDGPRWQGEEKVAVWNFSNGQVLRILHVHLLSKTVSLFRTPFRRIFPTVSVIKDSAG